MENHYYLLSVSINILRQKKRLTTEKSVLQSRKCSDRERRE